MPEIIADGAQLCVGFLLSPDGQEALLVVKERPKFLKGLMNGSGGHIEEGETARQAVARETHEETDLLVPEEEWVFLFKREFENKTQLSFFAALHPNLSAARKMTDEAVLVVRLFGLKPEQLADGCMKALSMAQATFGLPEALPAPADALGHRAPDSTPAPSPETRRPNRP